MTDFERVIEQAVEAQEIPGCVLVATNRDGTYTYNKAFGKRSMRENADQSPLQLSTIMWIASCTKLMTSISAMQLVERGILKLDEPVYTHIPELKHFPVIKGFNDDGSPIEEPHKNPITLRLLLTHSSGLTYDSLHPKNIQWLEYHKKEPGIAGTIIERFDSPLVYEPGEEWSYGPSIDYAGLLIERVTGRSLEEYMRENLWEPLGIKDMTFHLSKRPELKARMADMSFRDEETGKLRGTEARMSYQDGDGVETKDCMGGQGVFTSAEEYIKVLKGLLNTEYDEKILKKSTVEDFFRPKLGKGSRTVLNMFLQDDMVNNAMGGTPKEIEKDWGLGGVLITEDSPDGKAAGTMLWGGLPNLIWFLDRKTGLTGFYAGQVLPTGDAKCAAVNRKFEEGVYEQYRKSRSVNPRL